MRHIASVSLLGVLAIVSGGEAYAQQRGRGRFGQPEFRVPKNVQEFLQDFAPKKLEAIQRLGATDPRQLRNALSEAYQLMRKAQALKETDPDAYERYRDRFQLEGQVKEIIQGMRQSKDEQAKQNGKEKLKELLGQLFDIKCEEADGEIEAAAKRLEDMKQVLAKRRAAKERIVERHVNVLTGEDDYLRWDMEPSKREAQPSRAEEAGRGRERPAWGFGARPRAR